MKKTLIAMMLGIAAATAAAAAEEAADAKGSAADQALEARLEAARARLDEAAREVAELSAELGVAVADRVIEKMSHRPRRAILGVQLDPRSGPDGARVLEVSPGGPAEDAGIRPGDVIVAIAGEEITGDDPARKLTERMRDVEPDSKVAVRVLRAGKPQEFTVTARRAAPFAGTFPEIELHGPWQFHFRHALHGELADMELVTLTPTLGEYFGSDKGVLVVRAPAGSALKLQDGDVILTIDGREPMSGSHATRILRSYQPGEKITLRVMRKRKPITLEATLPEPERPRPRRREESA